MPANPAITLTLFEAGALALALVLLGAAIGGHYTDSWIAALQAQIASLQRASETESLCRQQERDNWLKAETQYQAQIAELEAKLNTPELHDFSAAVVLEAAHQRERWGANHDTGKQPADWFWLLGYLGGKALNAAASGNTDKALHHTISTAAACANWHAAIGGKHTQMRPGIDPVERGVEAAPSNPTP